MNIRSVFQSLINLLFPPLCTCCNRCVHDSDVVICLECQNALPRTREYAKDNVIEKRLWGKFLFERCWAFLYFEKGNSTQTLLHELKYKNRPQIGTFLAKMAASELVSFPDFNDVDVIVPVPLHPSKLRKRGYNQSSFIVQGLSSITNKPIDDASLIRTIANTTQTRKSVFDRHLNTKGVFQVAEQQALVGKHVLLVDDVLTTGATMEACASTLAQIPQIRISIFCLAVAK
jgi:ComF family protein